METTQKDKVKITYTPRDIHQQVTDTIIRQLEAGRVPWHKPWKGDDSRFLIIPENVTTGNKYRGLNIPLLWSSAIAHDYPTQEWVSFKQWQENKEAVRKGEKGSMVVYYDTIERKIDGEMQKIPFIKSSVVFNRSQLASFRPAEKHETLNAIPLIERIEKVDNFISH